MLLGFILVITFIYISSFTINEKVKKNKKFDFIPLVIMLIFGYLIFLIYKTDNNKFWTDVKLIGKVESEGSKLVLYTNGSFAISPKGIDFSCIYQGNYIVDNDTITLKRLDIERLTFNEFTSRYLINREAGVLKPIENNSKILRIQ